MGYSTNLGKIDHSLNQIFNPKDQDERKVCQLAVSTVLQNYEGSLKEQVRRSFALGTDALSEKKVQRVVEKVQALQQQYIDSGLSATDTPFLKDRLQAKFRNLEKLTSLPEGHLLEETALVPASIEMVFSSGVPLTQMGMLEAKALLAIASPLYKKKQEDGIPHEQAVEESVEESYQELQSCLLEKLPKCSLSGHPIRHPAYVNKEEFLDNNRPLNYYELAELERYALRTHQTPLFSDGQKLPFSLSDIRLDEAKQTEIDQARKVIYQEVLQKYPPASEDEALIVGIKHLEETRDDGVPSSLSLEDKALLEHHSLIDLAILSLAYPLYQETTLQNSPSSQEAEKAAEKAWVMITERFEKDPILSRYQDAIFLEVIRDPIETVLANGQSAYHDKSSEEALEVGKKDPSMHVPIQEIKEAPHVKAYLTKRKEQICQELVLYKRSEIKEAVKEEKLVEAVSNIQIVPTQPVSLGKFFKAAGNGDLKTIQEGLNQGLSINAKDNDGKTVLILAAENGKLNIVQYLVGDERVDLDAKDNDGRTALMLAEENGKLDIVQYLEGFTASLKKFFEAAGNGDLKTIQEGLNQRVPINAKGYYCRTALMLAAENGKLDIVQYLAEKDGIDLNAKDALGSTALMLAVENGLDIVRYLAEKDGIDLNAKNKSGLTVLMLAAAGGHLDVVQYLAEKDGIDLNAKRKDGLTVLMLAAGEGHLDVVQYLAGKEGVDLNAKSEYDMTALTLAARFGHLDVVQYLAGKEGVDLNEKDRYGLTVLMLAAAGGHLDVVQYLAGKEGVDLNAKSEDGMTARDFAEANGHYEIAEHLAARNTVRP